MVMMNWMMDKPFAGLCYNTAGYANLYDKLTKSWSNFLTAAIENMVNAQKDAMGERMGVMQQLANSSGTSEGMQEIMSELYSKGFKDHMLVSQRAYDLSYNFMKDVNEILRNTVNSVYQSSPEQQQNDHVRHQHNQQGHSSRAQQSAEE